jgi:hypothetical protein
VAGRQVAGGRWQGHQLWSLAGVYGRQVAGGRWQVAGGRGEGVGEASGWGKVLSVT